MRQQISTFQSIKCLHCVCDHLNMNTKSKKKKNSTNYFEKIRSVENRTNDHFPPKKQTKQGKKKG